MGILFFVYVVGLCAMTIFAGDGAAVGLWFFAFFGWTLVLAACAAAWEDLKRFFGNGEAGTNDEDDNVATSIEPDDPDLVPEPEPEPEQQPEPESRPNDDIWSPGVIILCWILLIFLLLVIGKLT